ncbi:hypothetical protein FHETE_9851 [Fusarium heterosporum]|uniref:AB hydrolase-1 domain-containing protein n=1 Tax=Fusarium heterosporum TaxID=42747 RepID=A0A8H5SRB9_FUSHE|nr:hypothetical protein FHETE_9851 [Fusarium heterosporum]
MEGVQSSAGSSAVDWSSDQSSSDHQYNSSRIGDSGQPKAQNPDAPVEEAMCRRSTFYVNVDWRMGATLATVTNIIGQMYVECIEPANRLYPYPIVLIHGDFHTGQTTKPDGKPGWASFFLSKGFQVFIVDLPPSGRSNFLTPSHYIHRDVGINSSLIPARAVETGLTAPSVPREPNIPLQYEKAALHNRWPGTGQRGDPVFAKYCASLVTLHLNKVERQSLAQNALQALLGHIGKSILLGEGSGGNMTWLATDVEPDLVAGTIALEPVGPPFGTACPTEKNPYREYSPYIQRQEGVRPYGLTDIPLTYDPPCHAHEGFDHPAKEPLDVVRVIAPDKKSECYMQKGDGRKLVNVRKVPAAVLTAHASSHGVYDWATAGFMMQAGVKCDWIRLESRKILGNGHLMFLEENSDEIAEVVLEWILEKAIPKAYLNILNLPSTPPETNEVAELIRRSRPRPRKRYSAGSGSSQLSGEQTQCLSSQSDEEAIQAQSLSTPQLPSTQGSSSRENDSSGQLLIEVSNKRPAPSSGQSTVSISGEFGSPGLPSSTAHDRKRPRIDYSVNMPVPPLSFPSLPSPSRSAAAQGVARQQHQYQPTHQTLSQQNHAAVGEQPVSEISMPRPTHPGGRLSQFDQQASADTQSPIVSPSLSQTSQMEASKSSYARSSNLYEHLPLDQKESLTRRENQHSFDYNNTHTTARFERRTGTAEESIAAMALYNPGRLGSSLTHSTVIASQQHHSPMMRPQQQTFLFGQLRQSPALSNSGNPPASAPTSTAEVTALANFCPPFTPLQPPSFLNGREQAPFARCAQSTPPSPSPAPRQSNLALSHNHGTGSPMPSGSQQTPTPK